MVFFHKIVFPEWIDANTKSKWKESDVCHYWYFLNKGFKFQPNVYDRCHDLLMMPMSLSDIVILNIKSADYRCFIGGISKSEDKNLMQNANLSRRRGTL